MLKDELQGIAEKYGDERRTEITSDEGEFTIEDLIAEEDMVVTISHSGYIKRTSVSTYRRQRRGGAGSAAQELSDEDFIERLFIGSTHDYILVFTDDGRCFWLKVHEIPQAGRATKGKPIVNLINVTPDTQDQGDGARARVQRRPVPAVLHAQGHGQEDARSRSTRTPAPTGIKAIKIEQGDELIDVQVTSRDERHRARDAARPLGPVPRERRARDGSRHDRREGHRAARRRPVVGMVVIKREATLLVVTEKGLGKCSHIDEYRVQKRGGKGIITVNRTEKTGDVVTIMEVLPEDEIMIITRWG